MGYMAPFMMGFLGLGLLRRLALPTKWQLKVPESRGSAATGPSPGAGPSPMGLGTSPSSTGSTSTPASEHFRLSLSPSQSSLTALSPRRPRPQDLARAQDRLKTSRSCNGRRMMSCARVCALPCVFYTLYGSIANPQHHHNHRAAPPPSPPSASRAGSPPTWCQARRRPHCGW